MRRRASSALLLCMVLAAGCGSAPPPASRQEVHPLEQDALNALDLNLEGEALEVLEAALRRYESLDDLAGQWRVHLMCTRIAKNAGDLERAGREVERLRELARELGTAPILYETYILLAQIKEEPRYYDAALDVAASPLERAVVLTYLDRTDEAIDLVDPAAKDHPHDRAFVLFRYALKSGREEDLQRALAAYRRAEDPRGVADSLVHLSRLAASDNRTEQAKLYGRRAVTVLRAIGESDRAATVQSWLDQI